MPKAKYSSTQGLIHTKGGGIDFSDNTSAFVYRKQVLTVTNAASGSGMVDGTGITRQLKEEESGALLLINASNADDGDPRTTDVIVFMPTASAGLTYEFTVVGDQKHTGSDIVFKTADETSGFIGQKRSIVDGADGLISGSQLVFAASGSLDSTHVLGSSFEVVCDGTDWFVIGGVTHGSAEAVANYVSGSINRRK